jgi:hypothetical protein
VVGITVGQEARVPASIWTRAKLRIDSPLTTDAFPWPRSAVPAGKEDMLLLHKTARTKN